jgi:hypothetical protein
MASGSISTRPQAESAPPQGRYEDFIQKRLEHTRRQVRLADVASSLMLLAIASLLFFLAVAVLDHWVLQHGLSFIARLALFALWVAGAGAFIWRFLLPPLANRINPVFAAQTIEEGRPTLKNSLINFLLLRAHPQDVAPVVFRAMEHRAAADLLKVPVDHAVDRGHVVRLACALAAAVGVFALYLALSPKNPFVSAARVLWPWTSVPAPTRVHIEDVLPGNDVVFTDDRQEISAQVTGLRDGEEAALLFSTADGEVVDDRAVMTRVDDANHYRCELPLGSGGFQQDTFYRIAAGDAATQTYKLEVRLAPTILVDRIDYHFPPYTGQADRTIKNQGDIKALEGTQVTIHATANMDMQEARIDLNCDGLRTLSMTTDGAKATGQFTLALDPDTPGKAQAQYDKYQILFTDIHGHGVRRPVRYHIDVDRDLPPEIEIVEPVQEEVEAPADGQLRIRVRAFDPDFALRRVTLQGEREGHPLDLPVLLDRTKPEKAWPKPFDGEYVFRPADLKLKAGDLVRYWATADDNKEPRGNHSETAKRTIRVQGAGQSARQDPNNQPNRDAGPQPQDENRSEPGGAANKSGQGQGDSSSQPGGSKDGDHSSAATSKQGGQEANPHDPQHGGSKDPGQPDQHAGQGKEQPSSNPSQGRKSGEANSAEAGDEPNQKINPDTQRNDAIQKILEDREKQTKDQSNQPQPSSGDQKQDQKQDQKPDQKQDPGRQGENSQGSPQQGDQRQDGQKQSGQQGDQQSQGATGEKKDQGGTGNQQPQGGNSQPQGGKQDSGQNNSGQQAQGDQQNSSGQGNQKSSPQPGNSGGPSNGGSQPQGGKDSGNTPSANQPSSQNSNGQGSESKSSAGSKKGQNSTGQGKPDANHAAGEQGQQNQSAGGSPKSEKPQPGGQQGKNESAGGNSPNSETKQSGGQGPGDEGQLAQNGAKSDKKPSGSGGSDSQNMPGGQKPGAKPKDPGSSSQGGGQGSQSKPEEKQGGGGQSDGGEQPKPGQGDQPGAEGGGQKPQGGKPSGNKGGAADGEPGQKDPGNSGEPTRQDSSGAPDSQVDPDHGGHKSGDAHPAMNQKSDNPQSPGNSSHDSKTSSDTSGDRKAGGGAGGGQPDKKTGKGAAGTQTAAEEGGAVSDEHGAGATGKKSGEEVRSTDRTDSSRKQPGTGDGEKQPSTDEQTAKDDSQRPRGDAARSSADSQSKSGGGPAGDQASNRAGNQGGGLPAGGSQAGRQGPPPAPRESQGGPDAANLEFSNKQVDLALEHLKQQKDKQKSELLDRLGWTKEEAQKFLENVQKLKDSAQQPGSDGAAARQAYNEFLKNLDLHPHGTQIRGGKTGPDDVRNVHDSGQMEPPSEWADLFRAYNRSTAGQK